MDKILIQTFREIKSIEIQGATAVAREVVLTLKKYGLKIKTNNLKVWRQDLKKAAEYLLSARPTEPMAQNGVKFVFKSLSRMKVKNVSQVKDCLKKSANNFLFLMAEAARLIIFQGQKIIKNNNNIFTHCHSYLVEKSLVRAKEKGKKFQVFNTETRPLFQGHITAKKLLAAKIPVTMVVDSSSGFLISRFSGKQLMMDKVFLGADALLNDGSAVNKIGSFGVSLAAWQEKVSVYIIAPLLKFYPKSWIKIEKRPANEIWKKAPKKLKIINFAFDFIPAQYIKGIICEAGIIKPKDVKKAVRRIYPWIAR